MCASRGFPSRNRRTPRRPTARARLLAQEASAVTYDWDTDTLFGVVGDGGTSVVQVSKTTGALINSMTLAPGNSPQGTTFYDTEAITYVGGGQFVLGEERDRQVNLFTYVPGATLTRSDTKTVKLGSFVGNIGIEGISYDPSTSAASGKGFLVVKETQPQEIFQSNIDFTALTATNPPSPPALVEPTNLFPPADATGLTDFSDVFALSTLSNVSGPLANDFLIISQEAGKIDELDRNGNVLSSLTIHTDPGNPLTVTDQQDEGVTMDNDGTLYVANENGGGDAHHPQLWIYKHSDGPNTAPTAVALNSAVTSLPENTSTQVPVRLADIAVTDDGLGTNSLTLSGPDAGSFEIDGTGLFLKAGTALDFETKPTYNITVSASDPSVAGSTAVSTPYTLQLSDVPDGGGSGPGALHLRGLAVEQWQQHLQAGLVRGHEHRWQRGRHHRVEDGRQLVPGGQRRAADGCDERPGRPVGRLRRDDGQHCRGSGAGVRDRLVRQRCEDALEFPDRHVYRERRGPESGR